MQKIIIFLIMLNLMGCVQTIPTPKSGVRFVVVDKEERPSTAYELPLPPTTSDFDLSTKNGINSYTTAVNVYQYRIFFYTWMLNRYSLERDWEPPPIEPLCLFSDWPVLDDAPDVVISPRDRNAKGVEKTLTEYIKRSRALYEDQKDDYREFQTWHRRLCTF